MFSLWDKQSFLLNNDVIIIGGGISGLSCASSILETYPEKKVIILERGQTPQGASTKNGGYLVNYEFDEFIWFLNEYGEDWIMQRFLKKNKSVDILLKRLSKYPIDYQNDSQFNILGPHFNDYTEEQILNLIKSANDILRKHFQKDVYILRNDIIDKQGFNKQKIKYIVENRLCGRINVGETIKGLINYVSSKGGLYLTGCQMIKYNQIQKDQVQIEVLNLIDEKQNYIFETKNLIFCTNGFTNNLLKTKIDLIPLKGQLIITKPIPNLKIKGNFCADYDSFYFREHQGRILVGGGLDQEYINESSCDLVNSQVLQNKILNFLNECILLNTPYEIDFNWSGIMAISKKDITLIDYLIDKESENVFYVGRYCGRGMILSSIAGEEMRNLVYQGKSRL